MLELYSLQKVLWCKDRKKREPWFQNSKNKFQIDKKCLLTFFSVPLFFFINYLYTNNLCIYSIFIRRATKRGKKNILLNVEIELNPDLMAISGKG